MYLQMFAAIFSSFFADIMVGMGYSREEIHESLTRMKYDEITATYLLLGRKPTEVSKFQERSNDRPSARLKPSH